METSMTEWLRSACDKGDDEYRKNLREPFGATLRGVRYACATDGRKLLLVAMEHPDRSNAPPVEKMEAALFAEDGARTCRLEALRSWCRDGLPPLPAPESPCPRCNGNSEPDCSECDGSGNCNKCQCDQEHDCGYCDGKGTSKCTDCDGKGTRGKARSDADNHPGMLSDGVCMDRRLLLGLIDAAPGESVKIRTGTVLGEVTIVGDGWRGIVMPMRVGKERPPAFEGWLP